TARGHIRIKSHLLHGFCRCLTVITAVIGARNLLDHARGVWGPLNPSPLQVHHRQLGHGRRWLFVVGLSGDVTRHDALVRRIDTDLGIPTIVPAFVVGLHDLQLGVGKAHLRFVIGRLVHRFGRSAATLYAHALAFRLGFGTPLAFRYGL